MKFILVYVIVLLFLSANGVLSGDFEHKVRGNGTQIRGGFFSETIQGDIPCSGKMTSTLITSPVNEAILPPNEPFSVDVLIENLETGFFSDPDTEYYTKPQSLDNNGIIKGHTHVTIQKLNENRPPDAGNFEFFKGLNDKAKKGLLSVDVVRDNGGPGLPIGRYRVCTMSSSFTHQPLLMPIAKRGSQDDCIRINVGYGPSIHEKGKGKEISAKINEKGKGKEISAKINEKGKGKEISAKINEKGKGKGKKISAKINEKGKGRKNKKGN